MCNEADGRPSTRCSTSTISQVLSLAVVQIADFGLSRQLKAQTISTATYGTVRVDSPSCLPGSSTQAICLAVALLQSHILTPVPIAESSREVCVALAMPQGDDAVTGCSASALSVGLLMICTRLQVTHMPPELMLQQKLTTAADVFSFGVLLWEVCATACRSWPISTTSSCKSRALLGLLTGCISASSGFPCRGDVMSHTLMHPVHSTADGQQRPGVGGHDSHAGHHESRPGAPAPAVARARTPGHQGA